MEPFDLSLLDLPDRVNAKLPQNVRLGHLVEKVVSESIKVSANYRLIAENIQIVVDKQTIGELDFLVEDLSNGRILHIELAYKFYLYDPKISANPIRNWIGPNRRDSLVEKLEKLKKKQYPLLYHDALKNQLPDVDIESVQQASCFLTSLYIPYGSEVKIARVYQDAIKGHYFDFETFVRNHKDSKCYFLPAKTQWGISPEANTQWLTLEEISTALRKNLEEKRAPLIWEKDGNRYAEYFLVWW